MRGFVRDSKNKPIEKNNNINGRPHLLRQTGSGWTETTKINISMIIRKRNVKSEKWFIKIASFIVT